MTLTGTLRALAGGLFALTLLTGCAVSHSLQMPPSQTGNTAGGRPLAGTYAVHIDTRLLNGSLTVGGACRDVTYPMHMRGPYEARLRRALTARLEAVTFVAQPLAADALRTGGYAGQIVVVSEGVTGLANIRRASLTLKARIDVRLDLTHRVQIAASGKVYRDGPLETDASAQGEGLLDVCESAADALGVAFAGALDRLVAQIDEGLAPLRTAARNAN